MNQKSRQTATSNIKKHFYKLLNNSNFGIDCRNNIDYCVLKPIYDDFSEIAYIKYYATIFNDDTFKEFFCPPLLREEIISTCGSKIFALNKDEPTYEATKKYFERKKEEELDAVESLKKIN